MQDFLIESYSPRSADSLDRMGSASSLIASGHASVRVRWALFAPEDELCLWVLSAPSRPALERELARVGIDGHIQEAVLT